MVITILEAHVATDKAETLEQVFQESTKALDAGIVQTFLIHSLADASLWRIVTVWESREALTAMRQSGQTPRGVLIFREAGAEPILSVWDVPVHAAAPAPKS